MFYVLAKAAHLLAVIVWVGGMFFALYCLHPALAPLEAPARVALAQRALGHFFRAVTVAVAVIVLSAAAMLASLAANAQRAGLGLNMPLDWWLMAVLGTLMVLIFAHIRLVLFRRVRHAARAQDWRSAGAALARIRAFVTVNLALGVVIVVATRLGQAT